MEDFMQGMEQISGKRSVYGDDVLLGYLAMVRLQQARDEYSRARTLRLL